MSHEHNELDCAAVLADLSLILDGECTESQHEALKDHIDHCGPCLEAYGLEEKVKRLIGRKCGGERAPESLRTRLKIDIRSVVIRSEG